MSDEMFARLLDLVSQAGEGGFTLAVIYLFQGYFSGALFATVIIVVVYKINQLIQQHCYLAEILAVFDKSNLDVYYDYEKKAFLKELRQLREKSTK